MHPFGLRGSVVGRQQQVHVPVSRVPVRAHQRRLRGPAPLALAHCDTDETGKILFSPWTDTDFRTNSLSVVSQTRSTICGGYGNYVYFFRGPRIWNNADSTAPARSISRAQDHFGWGRVDLMFSLAAFVFKSIALTIKLCCFVQFEFRLRMSHLRWNSLLVWKM